MWIRVALFIGLIITMLFVPYPVFLGILLIAAASMPLYIEGMVLALLHDGFLSADAGEWFGFRSVTFLAVTVVVLIVFMLRGTFRSRSNFLE